MNIITKWGIYRSGGAMTIDGIDENGKAVKIAGIRRSEVRDGRVVATDDAGNEYHLVVA